MPATSTSVNASTNSTAEARKAAITIAHCIGVFLLLKTRPDREQRRAIPRRSHHEGRVFWWSWNHFLLIDGVLSALKWLDIVAPFGSRLGRAQRSAGSRGREIAREELFVSRARLCLRAADPHAAHPHRLDPGGPGRAAWGVAASSGPLGSRPQLSGQ